jgi:hypothetical protein
MPSASSSSVHHHIRFFAVRGGLLRGTSFVLGFAPVVLFTFLIAL